MMTKDRADVFKHTDAWVAPPSLFLPSQPDVNIPQDDSGKLNSAGPCQISKLQIMQTNICMGRREAGNAVEKGRTAMTRITLKRLAVSAAVFSALWISGCDSTSTGMVTPARATGTLAGAASNRQSTDEAREIAADTVQKDARSGGGYWQWLGYWLERVPAE